MTLILPLPKDRDAFDGADAFLLIFIRRKRTAEKRVSQRLARRRFRGLLDYLPLRHVPQLPPSEAHALD